MSRLICSRCGEPVTKSYEPGRCYNEQGEPAEMDEHDEAIPEVDVHDD